MADLVIRGALLIDGSGAPPRLGDLAVSDDRIAAMGDLREIKGAREIEGSGKALAPGFIDVHTHDDRALIADPLMACKASQGVTTVVTGNCGVSLAPLKLDRRPPPPLDLLGEEPQQFFQSFAGFLGALRDAPPAINAGCQVGHSVLRIAHMDDCARPARAQEIAAMRRDLEASLEAGAIGLSSGLYYEPARASLPEEVEALAEPLAAHGAIYTSHMRNEAEGILDSIRETAAVARHAKAPAVISHHKVSGRANHGRTAESLPLIDALRQEVSLGLDVYPYTASSTILSVSRLAPAERVLVTWSRGYPKAAGRDLKEVAAELGLGIEAAVERLLPAGAIYFMMSEEDVRRVLSYPHAMIGSDGLPHDEHPHPRLWGTFPRVLGHYARDVGLFPLEEAVRRMTSLPARTFGFRDRGELRVGAYADLVLFDPKTILDRATFEKPKTPAQGIALVMVNGRAVWQDGAATGSRPGKVLRREVAG